MDIVKQYNNQGGSFKSILFVILFLAAPLKSKAIEKYSLVFGAGITHNREANIFYQGEPIYISVSMRRTDSNDIPKKETLQIGTANVPWHKDVNITFYKLNNRTKLYDVHVILYSGSSKNELTKVDEADSASWITEPNSTSKLSPGRYLIDVSFNETNIKIARPNISIEYRGNKIEVDINEPKNNKQIAEVVSHQGEYYSRQKKQETAIKLFKQALVLDPTRQDIHCGIGRSYEISGDLDTAIKEYRIYVDWVHSLNIPRTGGDDVNLHADIIENNIKILTQVRDKNNKRSENDAD
jgi:tetratricopeptide (TPR) repeat protein